VSLNCDGFYSNLSAINSILIDNHVLLVQEHWLHQFEAVDAFRILEDFNCDGSLKFYDELDPIPHTQLKRGQAGTGIVWRKKLNNIVDPIPDGSNRVTGVRLRVGHGHIPDIILLSIYMPSRGPKSVTAYKDTLCELSEILVKYGDLDIIIGGDMNGSLHRGTPNEHDSLLKRFVEESGLCLHLGPLYPVTSSFVPSYSPHTSLIDYFIVSDTNSHTIDEVEIMELPSNVSPHRAVIATLKCALDLPQGKKEGLNVTGKPKWDKGDLNLYIDSIEKKTSRASPL
jgi:exonuclease III